MPAQDNPVPLAAKCRATLQVFDTLETPIVKGSPALLYSHGAVESCVVSKLVSILDRSGGVAKKAPRAVRFQIVLFCACACCTLICEV